MKVTEFLALLVITAIAIVLLVLASVSFGPVYQPLEKRIVQNEQPALRAAEKMVYDQLEKERKGK